MVTGGFIPGDSDFVNWIKGNFLSGRPDEKEIPQLKKLKPRVPLETVANAVCVEFGCNEEHIMGNGSERLAASESLKKKLERILEGEAPHDIFVRWKPIEKQPIGWNSDLNDGVRLNIRPFMPIGDVKKKGAGVLRDKPNIKWSKDRGKDVESAPWYHLFKGDRINNHHLTIEDKQTARIHVN